MNDGRVWAKLQEYDYEDVYKVAHATVTQFYFENVNGESGTSSKMRKLN